METKGFGEFQSIGNRYDFVQYSCKYFQDVPSFLDGDICCNNNFINKSKFLWSIESSATKKSSIFYQQFRMENSTFFVVEKLYTSTQLITDNSLQYWFGNLIEIFKNKEMRIRSFLSLFVFTSHLKIFHCLFCHHW